MSEPVTTIIPTFRRPRMLRRAIASALAQTYHDVRVCVYDNASGDQTESVTSVIAAQDLRVTYYRQERHVDVAENFLFGMQRVQTPYFSFLSDDDVLFPGFYASAVAQLRENPDALFAAGSVIEFDERGTVRYVPLAMWEREGRYAPPTGFFAMLGNRHPTWTGIVFRREALEHVGVLDPAVGGPIDLDYELRIALKFPYVISFLPSAGYIHHSDRVSSGETPDVIAGYRRIEAKLIADPDVDARFRAQIRARLERQMRFKLYEIAFKSVVAGNDANARDAARMLRREFSDPVGWGIDAGISMARALPPVRSAIAAFESSRVWWRSSAAQARLRASSGSEGSAFARYLEFDRQAFV